MPNFSTTSQPASSLRALDSHGANTADQINAGISFDFTTRFYELESQNAMLKEENRTLLASNLELEEECHDERRKSEDKDDVINKLEADVTFLTETVKRLKEKYETLREGSVSGDKKWKERLEEVKKKCWQLEYDNKKLERDVRRGADEIGELMEKMKAAERLLEEKDVANSEMAKKIENLRKEKMKVKEELGHRVFKLEESVKEWQHCTDLGNGKEKSSGVTKIAVDDLGCNVQHKGSGNAERPGPKSVGISTLIDPKMENIEADEQIRGPAIEKKPYTPKTTDAQIVEISDDEEEEEEKQIPSFASPSTTKRKSEEATWSAEKQDEAAKRCRFNGPTDAKLWQNAKQMYEAFKSSDKLCMKSICTLYRKHKSLGVWKNQKDGNKGFKHTLAARGVALGKILTDGDPEGRMKMSITDFVQQEPNKGLFHCKLIAQDHHEALFEIFSNNMDPLYLP